MRCNKCGKNLDLRDLTRWFIILGKNCSGDYKRNSFGDVADSLGISYHKLYVHATKGSTYIGRWLGHRVLHYEIMWQGICWSCRHCIRDY